jgi:hypothetical protein
MLLKYPYLWVKTYFMMKQILFIALFFTFSFAFSQELSITYTLPASAPAGGSIDAKYTLTKAPTMGSFAKFQLDLPPGFDAQSVDLKGGNFTFENNRVKIVWVSLPPDASFNFTFKLTAAASSYGNINFVPQFFYLENNVKKEYNVTPFIINFGGTDAAVPDNTSTPANTSPPDATATSTGAVADSSTVAKTVEVASTENTGTLATTQPVVAEAVPVPTTIPTPEPEKAKPVTTAPVAAKSNVMYHVQLAALTNKPSKSNFAQYGTVKIVEDAGLFKVLVGSFKTLEEARKYKADLISKGAGGCFVVAYENGVRVKI